MSTSAIPSLRLSLTAIAIVLFLVLHSATTISAINHTAGANKGWNPGVNYTVWANNHTYVGDLICYDNCSTEAKKYYYICGTDGCFSGMNVSVLAHPLQPPAPSALAADHSSNASAPSAECRCRSNAVMNFLLSLDTAVTLSLLALLILFHRR